MRLSRMRSHPDFKVEGRSEHFEGCWELELTPGEETRPRGYAENEELIYLVSGQAIIKVERDERELERGEVLLIKPRLWHTIANPSRSVTRMISVASRYPESATGPREERLESLEEVLDRLPKQVAEVEAIQTIIHLFDIGGRLSDQIERCVGLDNDNGLEALISLQKRLMRAVVEITRRYRGAARRPGLSED